MTKKKVDRRKFNEIEKILLTVYKTDKLCRMCKGPLEVDRITTCKWCDLKSKLGTRLIMIEDRIMELREFAELEHRKEFDSNKLKDKLGESDGKRSDTKNRSTRKRAKNQNK